MLRVSLQSVKKMACNMRWRSRIKWMQSGKSVFQKVNKQWSHQLKTLYVHKLWFALFTDNKIDQSAILFVKNLLFLHIFYSYNWIDSSWTFFYLNIGQFHKAKKKLIYLVNYWMLEFKKFCLTTFTYSNNVTIMQIIVFHLLVIFLKFTSYRCMWSTALTNWYINFFTIASGIHCFLPEIMSTRYKFNKKIYSKEISLNRYREMKKAKASKEWIVEMSLILDGCLKFVNKL